MSVSPLGLVGLGRMGGGMARRLLHAGHAVIGYDVDEAGRRRAADDGVEPVSSLEALVERLPAPRAVWVMVPHGEPTATTVGLLLERMEPGDLLVDGGNSRWTESVRHAERASAAGVAFVDVGVSGGVWGEEEGFNLMVGGAEEAVGRLEPILDALAAPQGWARVGEVGAGHFVKMIHNAVEYGMLQAIGEGFECLQRSGYDLDLARIARLWQRGSVVRSWLLELLGSVLAEDGGGLESIAPYVEDSGTGRWTVEYALQEEVPVPAITQALFERFASRSEGRFSHRVIAALRREFGGHRVGSG